MYNSFVFRQDIFEEEESLLNLHMGIIQENAELLTEEGRLLQQIQVGIVLTLCRQNI